MTAPVASQRIVAVMAKHFFFVEFVDAFGLFNTTIKRKILMYNRS